MKTTLKDINRFWRKTLKTKTCWTHGYDLNTEGYGRFWNCDPSSDKRRYLAHRYSWLITNGDIQDGLNVLHKCDNRICVRPDHLFLGTLSDNMIDRALKGKQNTQKLNFDQIREIFKRRNAGELLRTVAAAFKVSVATVSHIARREIWPTVTKDL